MSTASVSGVGSISIPSEEVTAGQDLGVEDTGSNIPLLRRSQRLNFISLMMDKAIGTKLLSIKTGSGKQTRTKLYYVPKEARTPEIEVELRPYKIVPYWDWSAQRHDLYPMQLYTAEDSFAASIYRLLAHDAEWYASHSVRIWWDETEKRFRVKCLPESRPVPPLVGDISILLADAIGKEHILTDRTHQIMRAILAGEEV